MTLDNIVNKEKQLLRKEVKKILSKLSQDELLEQCKRKLN